MAKRKKKDEKPKRDKILEYKGWKAGDRCYTVFSGDTKPSLCDIKEFHPGDNMTPSVSVSDVVTGKHRVTPFMSIADDAKSAKKLLPKDTNPALLLAIKGVPTYDALRESLRANIRFLADHGAISGGRSAHVVESEEGEVGGLVPGIT